MIRFPSHCREFARRAAAVERLKAAHRDNLKVELAAHAVEAA